MYIRSYSDLENTRKYAQLASWSTDHGKTGSWEEETQFPSPHSSLFLHWVRLMKYTSYRCSREEPIPAVRGWPDEGKA